MIYIYIHTQYIHYIYIYMIHIYNRGISYGTCLLAHHDSWVSNKDVQTQRRSLSRGGVGCIQENPIYAIWVCLRIVRIPVELQFDVGKSWKIMENHDSSDKPQCLQLQGFLNFWATKTGSANTGFTPFLSDSPRIGRMKKL